MQRRTLAIILSLAMLVGLVSATGVFTVSAATVWTADETGHSVYTTFARNTVLNDYMAEQGVTESALNNHMNPLTVYGEDGTIKYRQGSSANAANGLTRQLCDGDIGSNEGYRWTQGMDESPWTSRRVVWDCDPNQSIYFTFDLGAASKLTDFAVAGSQMDSTAYLLQHVRIYVSDEAYDGTTAATLGTEVFSHWGETSTDVNQYNYHVRLNTPVTGRYVTFMLHNATDNGIIRIGELAAYGTRLTYDSLGNAVRELRTAQDIPTYENALKTAVGKTIGGNGIPYAGQLLNGVISALTTNVDYLVTDEPTSTYRSGDKLYNSGSNFLGAAQNKGYTWFTVNEDGSYTVQNIPMSESKYTEKVTDENGNETTVTKYRRYVKAYIGWNGTRVCARADYQNEDRYILETTNQFYYDLGGVTDVEKVMVACGVNRGDNKYKNSISETVGDGELNTWNGTLENAGSYIVSGIQLYAAETLDGLMADGAFLESALVADFSQARGDNMDTAVELTLQNVKGRYLGFKLTTPSNNLRLSELSVKTGEKHGAWAITAAAAADTAADSLLNTVAVTATNAGNVANLGDGNARTKCDISTSRQDANGSCYIPGTETTINGTSGWSRMCFTLDSEVSIDSFLVAGSLSDEDYFGKAYRNRTIAYYRIYVSDHIDNLFDESNLVVEYNNVGDNVLGSNPASGAGDAFIHYLDTAATGTCIGLEGTGGAYYQMRIGEFHVYGRASGRSTTWTDPSDSSVSVPAVEDNLLAGSLGTVKGYVQHALKAGQEDELESWNPYGAPNFAKVFDGKTWAGYQKNADGTYVTNENGWKVEVDASSKWIPSAQDYEEQEDGTKTKFANYIWLDFDLGMQYNVADFFHAAADRGANYVDFFVTDKSVEELVAEGARPDAVLTGNVRPNASTPGTAMLKKLYNPVKGSHVIVRLQGDSNTDLCQVWVSELAVTGTVAEVTGYQGAGLRLSTTSHDLRFKFAVAAQGAAYIADDPRTAGDYSRDISQATVQVNGESFPVLQFGAMVSNLASGWEASLDSISSADGKYTKIVEAVNLYEIQKQHVVFTAVVTNIPSAYTSRELHARPYIAYQAADGSTQYIYGEIVSASVDGLSQTA